MKTGETLPLSDILPKTASHLVAGIGWAPAPRPGFFASLFGKHAHIDLNLVCLVFDAEKNMIANINGTSMEFGEGAIHHTGDDRMGTGSGDDEQIFVAPEKIPEEAAHLVFAMHSASGHAFSEIRNITCRLTAFPGDAELLSYTLPENDRMKAHLIACMSRESKGWSIKAIGESIFARTPEEYREKAIQKLS